MRGLGQLAADKACGLLDEYGYREAQVAQLAEREEAERALAEPARSSAHPAPPEDAYEALERAPEMTPGGSGRWSSDCCAASR